LRILNVINSLNAGGAQKLLQESLPAINMEKNCSVDILLLTSRNDFFGEELRKKDVRINVIPTNNIRNPINIFYIKKHIRNGKYDIVHTHLFPANYWTSIAAKLIFKNRPKFITTEHSTHNRRRDRWYFKYIDKFIYSSFDRVISISKKTQENLITWLDSKKQNLNKYTVIENGININRFKEAKSYLKSEINQNFDEKTKLVCMTGRFSLQKDQSTLIKAFKDLQENVHLLLIGEGELKDQHKNLAKQIGLENRVHFLGFRNDVDKLFKTSDIIVLSSHWEGFGLVAVEGMAAGKPVIASDVDGLREVVQGAGILFPKGDAKQLSKDIENLISDEKKYVLLSVKCLRRAEFFDIQKMTKRYLAEYEKLL
jgi:glycosyltransferase involved in cell wall biosynthesis